jgi:uncharacterized repeat protein (TIGR01451 family)
MRRLLFLLFGVGGAFAVLLVMVTAADAFSAAKAAVAGPNVWLEKRATRGVAQAGGFYIYAIRYGNSGDSVATNVVISDRLPIWVFHKADTSGLPTKVSGHTVSWAVGTLQPGTEEEFYVSVDVDPDPPPKENLDPNCAAILTDSADADLSNNESCSAPVKMLDTGQLNGGLWVRKYPEPANPAPGGTFSYIIEYGTDNSLALPWAALTDTLPMSTTFVSWDELNGWDNLWSEVSTSGGEFALEAPIGVPGGINGRIKLTLMLDPQLALNTTLQNSVYVTTPNDVKPLNNIYVNTQAAVSNPRYDVAVAKSAFTYVPVAGGWVDYLVEYENNGNVPVTIQITDTYDTGLTYASATWEGGQTLPAPTAGANELVWDLGEVPAGGTGRFHVRMDIDSSATEGTVLGNCAEIGIVQTDEAPADNSSCAAITVSGPGANLRVRKTGEWAEWSPEVRTAAYYIVVENIGTVTVNNATITDTYPLSMALDNGLDTEWSRLVGWQDDPTSQTFTATFSSLAPGEMTWFGYHASVPGTGPLPFGQTFTNTVELAAAAGEVDLSDNADNAVLTTGPDYYVEKTLISGYPEAGGEVTYSLRFGNNHRSHEIWWDMQGDAWVQDTLPAGVQFVSASLASCDWCPLAPDLSSGVNYSWNRGPQQAGAEDEIRVVVQLSAAIKGGDTLTNHVDIASAEPLSDMDPIVGNNDSSATFTVAGAPRLSIGQNGADVELSWPTDGVYVTNGYRVWASATPYFIPAAPASMEDVGYVGSCSYANTVGNGNNTFYLLVAIDEMSGEHVSNEVAKIEFAIVPGN